MSNQNVGSDEGGRGNRNFVQHLEKVYYFKLV